MASAQSSYGAVAVTSEVKAQFGGRVEAIVLFLVVGLTPAAVPGRERNDARGSAPYKPLTGFAAG